MDAGGVARLVLSAPSLDELSCQGERSSRNEEVSSRNVQLQEMSGASRP